MAVKSRDSSCPQITLETILPSQLSPFPLTIPLVVIVEVVIIHMFFIKRKFDHLFLLRIAHNGKRCLFYQLESFAASN